MSLPLLAAFAAGAPAARADWRVGRPAGGPLITPAVTLSAAGELTLGDKAKIPAGEWHALRRAGAPRKETAAGPVIAFTNGDRLCGRLVDSDGTTARVHPAFLEKAGQPVAVPLSAVAAYFVRIPADDEVAEFHAKTRSRDIIVNRRGDRLLGSVAAVDVAGFHLQDGAKTTVTDRSAVAAVWFNTDLARVRKPKGRYYRVSLADGTQWAVAAVSWDDSTVRLTAFGKETLPIPLKELIAVDVEQGPAVYLSDLKPTKTQYEAFDGETRTWQADRNALRRPLRLAEPEGESSYVRGVGLAGGMTLTYELGGKYKWFEAAAGMDARYGKRGDVTLRIFKDGKPAELHGGGRVGPKPVEVGLDVAGCKALTITVERGRRPGVEEMLNLANAKLIPQR